MSSQPTTPLIVLGALNLDICGISGQALRLHDSNPGRITMSAGGVGHNIARHLAVQGHAVELISLLGDDHTADILSRHCAAEGIGLRHALQRPSPSSTYLCIHDIGGELAVAVNDMSLLDLFTPVLLEPLLPTINGAQVAVTDANLPQETLELLARKATVPLFLDPVSTFKAERVRGCIGAFTAIKPNLLEAQHLTGAQTAEEAAAWFLAKGVQQVYISLGADGLYYASQGQQGHLSAPSLDAPNTNGAGDALCAGIVTGMLQGLSTAGCAALGLQSVSKHLVQQGGTTR